ncbi:MAG: MBL fold metallo-hydrolase [Halarcobacter sp.]
MEIITCNNNEIKINSYIIKEKNHAIVIDPNDFEEIIDALGNCKLDYIFLTHEHFDHIMAVDKLRARYNAKLVAQKHTSENIQKASRNLSKFSNIILDFMNVKIKTEIKEFTVNVADIIYDNSYKLIWKDLELKFFHTPGHSEGSSCIIIRDYVFSGDSLFECWETDTRGKGCSKKDYLNITMPFFKSLNKETKVLAGHCEPFILEDKINAKEKAIKIFKNRVNYSNCFVTYDNFLKLLDDCTFFTRGDSLFLLKKESVFFKFYYFVNDYKELTKLDSFFYTCKQTIIMEVVSKEKITNLIYEQIGFETYKTYSRYIIDKEVKKLNTVEFAKEDDIKEIKKLIDDTFDPLSDYIPTREELLYFVKNKELYIVKNNIIVGIAIYIKNGNNYYFRLSCVHPDYRNGFIGYILASNIPSDANKVITWVDNNNESAKKLNLGIGYKPDNLQNHIFIKQVK